MSRVRLRLAAPSPTATRQGPAAGRRPRTSRTTEPVGGDGQPDDGRGRMLVMPAATTAAAASSPACPEQSAAGRAPTTQRPQQMLLEAVVQEAVDDRVDATVAVSDEL
jgi:hypothetical protein